MLVVAGCGSNEGPPDAHMIDARPPGGTFSLQWTIHDGTSPLVCSDISAQAVSVEITPDNAGFGVVDSFSCSSATGTTRALDPGLYTLNVELDGIGGALGAPQKFMHVEAKSSQDTPLGALDFMVVAQGGLKMTLATQDTSSNCAAGGAGIEDMTVQLASASGTCIPATFMVAAGAQNPASVYVSDCNTLPLGPCIEKDQEITVTGLRSGQVKLVVDGDIGGKACWSGVNFVTVPSMNSVKDYALLVGYVNATCPRIDAL